MIIDFHTHAFPDTLAPRAIAQLAACSLYSPETDGTVSDLLQKMRIWKVDKAVICNIATNPRQQTNVNDFAIRIAREHEDKLYPLGSVHPASENIQEELTRLYTAGIRGIKLHPDYMGYTFDDPIYGPILDTAAQYNMFVIIHTGYDCYSPKKLHASHEHILTVLTRHPTLKLICAHYGNNRYWDHVENFLAGKNIWIDTSMGCREGLSPSQAKRILTKHDSSKILFGSDCPWCTAKENIEFLLSLGLGSDLVDKIFYKNALTLLEGTV